MSAENPDSDSQSCPFDIQVDGFLDDLKTGLESIYGQPIAMVFGSDRSLVDHVRLIRFNDTIRASYATMNDNGTISVLIIGYAEGYKLTDWKRP